MLFVCKMHHLIDPYNHATTMEGISLKATIVLPALVLQSPHTESNEKMVRRRYGRSDNSEQTTKQ